MNGFILSGRDVVIANYGYEEGSGNFFITLPLIQKNVTVVRNVSRLSNMEFLK